MLALIFAIPTIVMLSNEVLKFDKGNENMLVSAFSGSGTLSSPYLISTPEDVEEFFGNSSKYKDGYYKLTNDINCSSVSLGSSFQFNGVFDGGGYTLSGLTSFNYGVVPRQHEEPFNPRGLFGRLNATAVVKNLSLENCSYTTSAKGQTNGIIATDCSIGLIAATAYEGSKIENCKVKNFTLINTYEPIWNDWYDQYWQIAGICLGNAVTITNCYVENLKYVKTTTSDKTSQMKLVINYIAHRYSSIENCVVRVNDGNSDGDTYSTDQNIVISKDVNRIYDGLSSSYWFIPKTDEYNAGWPMLKSFIDWETYTVTTVSNTDEHAVDKGTVNKSEFKVPIPKDDPSKIYDGFPENNSTNQTIVIKVTDQDIVAKPACETCRQFSHWEINGKTITAHFKEKEVPANCTVKFNGHSFANTTSNLGLYEFKLHPGSTIKCVESNNGRTYTYIVVTGGDCPDCDRPLTTGAIAGIVYTLKIDAGQPASKYELDSLDSGGLIKNTNVSYVITKSTTISPTFKLKEYDVEIG